MSLSKKLNIRNIVTSATVGVFLYCIVYGIHNIEKVSQALESSSLLAAFVGSFLTIIPIVYFFYYRKTQTVAEP